MVVSFPLADKIGFIEGGFKVKQLQCVCAKLEQWLLLKFAL
jgi:hypothetical protein